MTGFLPSLSDLGSTDEYKNIRYTITYTDINGVSYPVTIQPVDSNDTISLSYTEENPKVKIITQTDIQNITGYSIQNSTLVSQAADRFDISIDNLTPPFTIEAHIRNDFIQDMNYAWNVYLANGNYALGLIASPSTSFSSTGVRYADGTSENGNTINNDFRYVSDFTVRVLEVDSNWNYSYYENYTGISNKNTLTRKFTGTIDAQYRTTYNKLSIGININDSILAFRNKFNGSIDKIRISSGLRYNTTSTPITNFTFPVDATTIKRFSFEYSLPYNTITGYYSDSFENFVDYRTKQDTFVTVNNFIDINEDELYGVYHYRASDVTSKTYSYIATANNESKTYNVNVTNNWDQGRNTLLRYINKDYGNIIWVNLSGFSVTWVNNNNEQVTWDNDQ